MAGLGCVDANIVSPHFYFAYTNEKYSKDHAFHPFPWGRGLVLRSTIPREMTIVYRRLSHDVREFPGVLREATASRLVIESPLTVDHPVRVSDDIIADTGYLSIWFVYKNRGYDVGKFYDRHRRWVGYYCDITKPLRKLLAAPSRTMIVTDLFLDLWITRDGRCFVLDEEELANALVNHVISSRLAYDARRRLKCLAQKVKADRFPLPEVRRIEPLQGSR